jgi:hypothetical protein
MKKIIIMIVCFMVKKSIHEELEQRIKMFEAELSRCKHDVDILEKIENKNALKLKILWMASAIIAFHDAQTL